MLGFLILLETEEDRTSFEEMYKKTYLQLIYIARSILMNQPDAEEIVHDVYVRMAENFTLYRGRSLYEMTGLGIIMTRNLSLNRLRFKIRHRECSFEQYEYIFGQEDTTLEDIIKEETLEELKAALMKLKQKERDILALRYYYKFSYKQIGKVFDMRDKTVEVRLRRIKRKLQKIMGEQV